MTETHLKEVESLATRLASLKALLGMSRIDDSDWETISGILDDFSCTLKSSVDEIRVTMQEKECCFASGSNHSINSHLPCRCAENEPGKKATARGEGTGRSPEAPGPMA